MRAYLLSITGPAVIQGTVAQLHQLAHSHPGAGQRLQDGDVAQRAELPAGFVRCERHGGVPGVLDELACLRERSAV